jgi:hypothetical protein
MEGEEEEVEVNEDNDISTGIGTGDNKQPADKANSAQTDLSGISKKTSSAGEELEDYDKVKDLTEGEDEESEEMDEEYSTEDDEEASTMEGEGMEDEDELDLNSIIRELEAQIAGEEEMEEPAMEGEEEMEEPAMEGEEEMEEPTMESDMEAPANDEEINLDEILREMGYGDDEEEVKEGEEANHDEENLHTQATRCACIQ